MENPDLEWKWAAGTTTFSYLLLSVPSMIHVKADLVQFFNYHAFSQKLMKNSQVQEEFGRLVAIMDELREKCPWDQKQTIESLRSLTIEETYELADVITRADWKGIPEEL